MKREGWEKELHLTKWLIILLIFLSAILMITVRNYQNYTRSLDAVETVRGMVQRFAKLQVVDGYEEESVQLQKEIENLLHALQCGDDCQGVAKIRKRSYKQDVTRLEITWNQMRLNTEEDVIDQTLMTEKSEQFYRDVESVRDFLSKKQTRCSRIIVIIDIEMFIIFGIILYIVIKQTQLMSRTARRNTELSRKAYTDVHTGLPNKSRCEEVLRDYLITKEVVCCMMFDLNDLKKINDNLGHAYGDALIKNFANILQKSIRDKDFVGRYGGDEFVAVLYGVDDTVVQAVLDRINEAVERNNENPRNMQISYSYGFALSSHYGKCTMETLLQYADHNMYEYKKVYKNSDEYRNLPEQKKEDVEDVES